VSDGTTLSGRSLPIFPGTIKAPQIIEFPQHLLRHLRPPLLVI
jgi:hypothetical protein